MLPIATGRGEQDPSRTVFSEYHAHGTSHGIYMIRRGSHKYVHYVDGPDQLFDLETDPDELTNRAGAPKYQDIGTSLKAELREIVDPEAVDERARRNQRRRRNEPGLTAHRTSTHGKRRDIPDRPDNPLQKCFRHPSSSAVG
ncbi:sulfatase/phosphatase domain-containing protein [Halomicroarcula sp. GCM10025710]